MQRGFRPRFGTWHAPSEPVGIYGRRGSGLLAWLGEMRQVHAFDAIGFEAPIVGAVRTGKGGEQIRDTAHEARLLIGLAFVVETFAGTHSIPCVEVPVPTAKRALTGDSYADKKKMIDAAVRLGWDVANDHQADAGAVGLVVTQTLWPKRSAA